MTLADLTCLINVWRLILLCRLALWSVNCYLLALLFDTVQTSLQAGAKMFPETELIARAPLFHLEMFWVDCLEMLSIS